jgi:DNA-directed RNA polymerase subunit RPC12/RpoP
MGTCFCQTGRYKQHWVCFRCRKMFKKQSEHDQSDDRENHSYLCPECGRGMHNMGKEFEPPARSAAKKWADIERRHVEIQARSMTIRRRNSEPVGAANRSQPVRSGTNQPSAAAGSGR